MSFFTVTYYLKAFFSLICAENVIKSHQSVIQ